MILGKVTEEQLDIWCKEIDEEEHRKEQEALTHAQWLKEREQRKQEIERAWRPSKPLPIVGQKRKNSDSLDSFVDTEHLEDLQQPSQHVQSQEPPKPALSPLLTSLLKSPSQVQNASILHSAITNRNVPSTNTNPTIASLLNSSANVQVIRCFLIILRIQSSYGENNYERPVFFLLNLSVLITINEHINQSSYSFFPSLCQGMRKLFVF